MSLFSPNSKNFIGQTMSEQIEIEGTPTTSTNVKPE